MMRESWEDYDTGYAAGYEMGYKVAMREAQVGSQIYLEGNKGGDTLLIEDNGDGTINLRVGHCCVYVLRHVVPVEFVTAALAAAVTRLGMTIERDEVVQFLEQTGWQPDFVAALAAKVHPLPF